MADKVTAAARLAEALGYKPYKAFGSSGKKARRIRDMIHARRRAPVMYGIPGMDEDHLYRAALRSGKRPEEAAREVDEFIASPPHLSVTGGSPFTRDAVRGENISEHRRLSEGGFGGSYYGGGDTYDNYHVGPYAVVRGLPGSGHGRHESHHLISDQMYRDPELRKSMPLLMRVGRALEAGKNKSGTRNLLGSLIEEQGARMAEIPRGGPRPQTYRSDYLHTVGSRPIRERLDRLASFVDLKPSHGKYHWPEAYGERWRDHQLRRVARETARSDFTAESFREALRGPTDAVDRVRQIRRGVGQASLLGVTAPAAAGTGYLLRDILGGRED